jgi:hypothetical protein
MVANEAISGRAFPKKAATGGKVSWLALVVACPYPLLAREKEENLA